MSLSFQVLGEAGRDNALSVRIDSGQAVEQLLFDCGDGCLSHLSFADIRAIDQLFFSHFHMDHVGGFDTFFRCNFNRDSRANQIWGPPGSSLILQHRFQGFLWNLHDEMTGTWRISEIHPHEIQTTRYELAEAFHLPHDEGTRPYQKTVFEGKGYSVDAITMDHRTPTIAYLIREAPRTNINLERMSSMGLRPGTWLKQLKDPAFKSANIIVNGTSCSTEALRLELLIETPGNSIAYLTDFLLDESAMDRLTESLQGCQTIVCEGQYRHSDLELARKNYHMTTVQSATLAKRIGVEQFVLFHLSDRYDRVDWIQMLREARQICPQASYPSHWKLDVDAGPTE